jgi:hypothetical protein
MRTRKQWGFQLFVSCLLAVSATAVAQRPYPPNGPTIPLVPLTGGGSPPPTAAPAPGPRDRASQWNMELVGHNDLQGRSAYQPIIINQDGRQIAYVGHHNNQKPLTNPLTGKLEVSGTSIVDVTDPAKTQYLAHIPTGEDRRTGGAQMVRVCSGNTLPHGVKGKWYLLRPLGGSAHEIWDVTDPSKPTKLTTVVDNLTGTHKSWWECDTGIAYLVANNSKDGPAATISRSTTSATRQSRCTSATSGWSARSRTRGDRVTGKASTARFPPGPRRIVFTWPTGPATTV